MKFDKISVLHVDDEEPTLDLAKTCLEQCAPSLNIVTERSVAAGRKQLDQRSIDCIVSDYEMPGQDGLEFLQSIRDEYPSIPFILYTRRAPEDIGQAAVDAGIDGYFQKHVGNAQYPLLANKITTLVEKYYTEQRLTYLEREQHITDGGLSLEEARSVDVDQQTTLEIVNAIADREEVDPVELSPPLNQAIDCDALEALCDHESTADDAQVSVTFSYRGYTITVTGDGEITIEE